MDLSGYLLEPLREDGEFVLYRARAKHLELPSVLLLSLVSSRPSVQTLKKIDHEYSLKGELDATFDLSPYPSATTKKYLCSRIWAGSRSAS